jgi:hypothetical protein
LSLGTDVLTDNLQESAISNSASIHSGFSPSTVIESPSKRASSNRPILPEYLKPVPEHLSPDDLEYLHKKGSFEIPSENFRNALICSYSVGAAGRPTLCEVRATPC